MTHQPKGRAQKFVVGFHPEVRARRCSPALRRALEEAAKRSGISLSEQARISLERLYQVEEREIWLPEVLRKTKPKQRKEESV